MPITVEQSYREYVVLQRAGRLILTGLLCLQPCLPRVGSG